MPTNTMITKAIVAGTVPPDLNCPRDGQAIVDLVANVCSVADLNSGQSGSTSDSVAQQALQTANIALSTSQQALEAVPSKRSSGAPIALPTGDSAMPVAWSPAMPDSNYEVRGTFYGSAAYPTTFFGFHVEDGTRTPNGCTIRFSNVPASFQFAWAVESL